MKNTLSIIALFTLLALPLASRAAMYHYLNLQGEVVTVEADTPAQALAISRLNGDALNSGVAIDIGRMNEGESFAVTYEYLSTMGMNRTIEAANMDAAYVLANDIVPGTLRPIDADVGE